MSFVEYRKPTAVSSVTIMNTTCNGDNGTSIPQESVSSYINFIAHYPTLKRIYIYNNKDVELSTDTIALCHISYTIKAIRNVQNDPNVPGIYEYSDKVFMIEYEQTSNSDELTTLIYFDRMKLESETIMLPCNITSKGNNIYNKYITYNKMREREGHMFDIIVITILVFMATTIMYIFNKLNRR